MRAADTAIGNWQAFFNCCPASASRLLEDVLVVCRRAASLSVAGRALFEQSRERKKIANDADRLRKYLARFDLEWSTVKERLRTAE